MIGQDGPGQTQAIGGAMPLRITAEPEGHPDQPMRFDHRLLMAPLLGRLPTMRLVSALVGAEAPTASMPLLSSTSTCTGS